MLKGQDSSGRRKTSKYFASSTATESGIKETPKDEKLSRKDATKRKKEKDIEELQDDIKPAPAKKLHKDEDDDFVATPKKKIPAEFKPSKKLKSDDMDDNDVEELDDEDAATPVKAAGRGRGGRGSGATAGGRGRGRGGGRGGFMNFGERNDPPHKGEKVNI